MEPTRVPLSVASTPQPCRVALQETVVIPTFHDTVVPAAIVVQLGHQPNMCCGMVELRQEFLNCSETIVAKTLVNEDAMDIPVRLAKYTADSQTIYKDTHVGHFVPIQDEERDYETSVNSCEIETHPGLDSERPISDPFDIEHLTSEQRNQLEPLICKYRDIFSSNPNDIGQTSRVSQNRKNHATPVRQQPRPLPVHTQQEVRKHI